MRIIGIVFLLFLLACHNTGGGTSQLSDTAIATVSTVPMAPDTSSLAGRWYLQPVLPSDTATGKIPWLELNTDLSRFTGNTGCNSMHGKFYFSKTDSSLSFSDKIFLSRMACPGFNELGFLRSLTSTVRFKLRHDTLIFIGDGHVELSKWIRKMHK
jgi:heat shock protein HslJ